MKTVLDLVRFVLPDGSVEIPKPAGAASAHSTSWLDVCVWPADLFAVAATFASRCGFYAAGAFSAPWDPANVCDGTYHDAVLTAGQEWRSSGQPPLLVRDLWRELVNVHGPARLDERGRNGTDSVPTWHAVVFKLLAIADEACTGLGFATEQSQTIANALTEDYKVWARKLRKTGRRPQAASPTGGDIFPYIPHSLCLRVPPTVACVQPKTNTPTVGCTVRSLTHHVALLPPIGDVTTHWIPAPAPPTDESAFNVLVVPYPYQIPDPSFLEFDNQTTDNDRAFAVAPRAWMGNATASKIAQFLGELVAAADAPVHCIVLPELSLPLTVANKVAEVLAASSKLEIFLVGVLSERFNQSRNQAATYRFHESEVVNASFQSKHHRWCLDGRQIKRYGLSEQLDPATSVGAGPRRWWEGIDVTYRDCYVTLVREGATMSVLICEDLARYDPVLTVMNAIGPNLVIALLMDGPQVERRWCGRYAMSLVDDPGSSVLTVSCLGMVARDGTAPGREVALWKDPERRATPLSLGPGEHAIMLQLHGRNIEQVTLDGRCGHRTSARFTLATSSGVRHPAPPTWLGTLP